jgi:predicted RNase H-like nuclease (RuvC/YqgF family)
MKKALLISIAAIIYLSSFTCPGLYAAEDKNSTSILDYKDELALTDKQEKSLKDIIEKLKGYLAEKQDELTALRTDLNKMISESADLDKIKAKLELIAKIQVDASYETILSSRAIETEITGTQLTKWRTIQMELRKKLQEIEAGTTEPVVNTQAKE